MFVCLLSRTMATSETDAHSSRALARSSSTRSLQQQVPRCGSTLSLASQSVTGMRRLGAQALKVRIALHTAAQHIQLPALRGLSVSLFPHYSDRKAVVAPKVHSRQDLRVQYGRANHCAWRRRDRACAPINGGTGWAREALGFHRFFWAARHLGFAAI